MIVERGTRDKLEKFFDLNQPLNVTLQVEGSATYNFCCFGVDKDEKISDYRYVICNQFAAPAEEVVDEKILSGMEFNVELDKLPTTINKLVFTCSIDGEGNMSEISRHKILIGEEISAEFVGTDFRQETALTSLEIYRKNGWRFNVVARGFKDGLDALLAFYGGEVAELFNALTKLGLDAVVRNRILNNMQNLEPTRQQAFIEAVNVLVDEKISANAAQRMTAYNIFVAELSKLDVMPDTSSESTKKSLGRTIAKGGLKALKTVGGVTLDFGGHMMKTSVRCKHGTDAAVVGFVFGGALALTGFAAQKAADYVDKLLDDE